MTPPTITVDVDRLSVELAELLIRAEFATAPDANTELRGRLMGPRCPGTSTIEIAYPLRPLPITSANLRTARVIIPEPNLWTEKKPLTYWGPVEIWLDHVLEHSQLVEVGLRNKAKNAGAKLP